MQRFVLAPGKAAGYRPLEIEMPRLKAGLVGVSRGYGDQWQQLAAFFGGGGRRWPGWP
ncbi:MAG: hypothetical protein JO344_05910 [Planctomycetaceae bacterium]|nr:hypothetical protein [Planctomycetaceae bacterium]